MGVKGLWKELETAQLHDTLINLSVEAFKSNPHRSLRLGVDVSLWLFQSKSLAEDRNKGHNADIRDIYYKLAKLLRNGCQVFLVFDGPNRPSFKRGHKVGGSGGTLRRREETIMDLANVMGIPWRRAPGEAEAELAACCKRGEIDAILSDDVDTLVFGANWVIRNSSPELTGNKAATPRRRAVENNDATPSSSPVFELKAATPFCDQSHYFYHSDVIAAEYGFEGPDLVLAAVLAGGDYNVDGCPKIGMKVAMPLVKLGHGRTLVDGFKQHRDSPKDLDAFLENWRQRVADDLRHGRGELPTKRHQAADTIISDPAFPSREILAMYLDPVISTSPPPAWTKALDLAAVAVFVQNTFQWSNDETVLHSRNTLYGALVIDEIRQAALAHKDNRSDSGRSAITLLLAEAKIWKLQNSSATGYSNSYRLEIPRHLDTTVKTALPTIDPYPIPVDPSQQIAGRRQKPVSPPTTSDFRHWVPVHMFEAHPLGLELARNWARAEEEARLRTEEEKARKAERAVAREASRSVSRSPRKRASPQKSSRPPSSATQLRLDKYATSSKTQLFASSAHKKVEAGSSDADAFFASLSDRLVPDFEQMKRDREACLTMKAATTKRQASASPPLAASRIGKDKGKGAVVDREREVVILSDSDDEERMVKARAKGKRKASQDVECLILD